MGTINNWNFNSQNIFLISVLILVTRIMATVKDYQKAALVFHNVLREKHDAPKLYLDEELNELANKCADYYGNKANKTDHNCPYKGTHRFHPLHKLGENLYHTWSFIERDSVSIVSEAVMWWYDGRKYYDVEKGDAKKGHTLYECLHFTQMVWHTTRMLGIGHHHVKKDNKDVDVIVALYGSMGNIVGKFKQNVHPPNNKTRKEIRLKLKPTKFHNISKNPTKSVAPQSETTTTMVPTR